MVPGNLGETAVDRLDGVSEPSGVMGVDQTGRRHRSRWHGVDEDRPQSLAGIGLKPGRKQIELLQQKLMALARILAPLRRMQTFEIEQDDKRITRLFPGLHELGERLAVICFAEIPAIARGGEGAREL